MVDKSYKGNVSLEIEGEEHVPEGREPVMVVDTEIRVTVEGMTFLCKVDLASTAGPSGVRRWRARTEA